MIWLYSGTPGSGKSLNVARDIVKKLRRGQSVIANFPIDLDYIKLKPTHKRLKLICKLCRINDKWLKGRFLYKLGKFMYLDNSELKPEILVEYAKQNHKKGREGQTLIVIDECPTIFNPRDIQHKDRPKWIKYFQLHRHLGFNIILIAQNDRLIDRQIRCFIEYDCKHRKANNFRTIGTIFSLLHIKLFAVVTYWYGVREKCSVEFFKYNRGYSKIYDSYAAFDRDLDFSL